MTSGDILQIIISIITVIGTGGSAFAGIMIANKMANYRIDQLEKKVEVHNSAMQRIVIAEQNISAMWRKVDPYDGAVTRLNVLESECKDTKQRIDRIEARLP